MSEIQIAIESVFLLWLVYLHWQVSGLRHDQEAMSEHLRSVADQVNRLQREVRGK
jgi:hypothetical protein